MVPVQILLINLVTDGLPALALGVEPKERSIMDIPPRDPREGILSRTIVIRLFIVGTLIAMATLVPFILYKPGTSPANLAMARTAAFITLAFAELWRSLSNRSERLAWWRMPLMGNPKLILAILSSAAVLLAVLYIPVLADTFQVTPPSLQLWGLVAICSVIPMLGAELAKKVGPRERIGGKG